MSHINSRKLSYKILLEIYKNKKNSNEVIKKHLENLELDFRDKNLVRKIVYGSLENDILLKYYIKKITNRSLSKIDLEVQIILEIGMYQILFLDKVPNSAAVNESVKIAKKVNYKVTGFINGVLRNFIRKKDEFDLSNLSYSKKLSIKYSYKKWIIDYFIENFGKKSTEKILNWNSKAPEICLRTNSLKISRDDLIEELKKYDIIGEKSDLTKSGIIIKSIGEFSLTENEFFQKGYFYIQDDASIYVGEVLDPKEDDLVLDVCAAPGGKTTYIAELMKDKGKVVARDVSEYKINLIKENIKRLGLNSIETQIYDGRILDLSYEKSFDKILVDAPCSGLGIIRKTPEIKINKSKQDLIDLSKIQLKILNNSAKLLKEKGVLVYSTCTLGNIENNNVINKFLSENNDFYLSEIKDQKMLQLLPGEYNSDGFFIAKLVKK